jgi:RimJ/RimL family protein N-acetyltransferase
MSTPQKPRATFVLRELRWEDFPARLDAYLSLYDEVKENPDLGMSLLARAPAEPEEVDWFAGLYRRVRSGDDIAVVGEIDGRAVGLVTIVRSRFGGRESENGHVGVLGILVDRRYRSQGLGEAMMRRALELARGQFEIVRLVVFSVNVRAKRLYERLGFRVTGRLEAEVRRNGRYLDEEMMMLDLRGPAPSAAEGESSVASRREGRNR